MRIFRVECVFVRKFQCADKCLTKFRQKVQRAAKKCDISPDRLAAGKSRYCLIDNRLENRSGKVFPCCAFVYERLDIRFCKHAAACGYRIYGFIFSCIFIKTGGIRLKKISHLVDKRARSSGTYSVHALFEPV